ncbi:GL25439 [Drosophila persimilis]|uniref:GL25439 n=1 Tax=Drosophila persimilis TaxID=7234 RepID=B4GU67_DROPE|nr:GL25439 [Drosophila persimilis]
MSDTKKIGDRPSRRRDHERDPEWNQEQNNNMFNRLLQTLATEQQKLMVLEQSRGQLMEDMRNLRARFMQENALLRRIIQRGASLEDVVSLRANPSRSATRSRSFARQSPASSRQPQELGLDLAPLCPSRSAWSSRPSLCDSDLGLKVIIQLSSSNTPPSLCDDGEQPDPWMLNGFISCPD